MFLAGESVAIHARAGSGKTATIVACLMAEKTRGIALAFMNKAVEEIASRLGPSTVHTVSTLNSAGLDILKEHWAKNRVKMNLQDKKLYLLIDKMKPGLDYATKKYIVDAANVCRAGMVDPDDFNHLDEVAARFWLMLNTEQILLLSEVMKTSARMALNEGVIDFEDMIWVPAYMKMYPSETFEVVAIDEAQDLTTAKRELALMFLRPGGRVIVAGDRCQAIQGWSGAERQSFDAIVGAFKCKEVTLSVSRRFGPNIAKIVKPIVPDIVGGGKGLDRIMTMQRIGTEFLPGKTAIIARYNSTLIELAMNYYKRRIPCKLKKDSVVDEIVRSLWAIKKPNSFRYENFDKYVDIWLNEKKVWAATVGGLPDWVDKMEQHADLLKKMKATSDAVNVKELEAEIDFLCKSETGPILITAHSSKGMEFDNVYLLSPQTFDPTSRTYPNQSEIDEAYNLVYVAYTRAKDNLVLVEDGELR